MNENERRASAPLSRFQLGFWVAEQLQETTYVNCNAMRVFGAFDTDRLAAAWRLVARRHASLRTVFREVEGAGPSMVVADDVDSELEVIDVRGRGREEVRGTLLSIVNARFALGFESAMRCVILRTADDEWIFLITGHHISADFLSVDILLRELEAHYLAFARGEAAPDLPPESHSFLDFVRHEAKMRGSERERGAVDYWKRAMAGVVTELALPTDAPRTANNLHRLGTLRGSIPAATYDALCAVGKPLGASAFRVLVAAWAAFLQRLSRQDEVVIGTPTGTRPPGWTDVTGPFVNMVPLRVRLQPSQSFVEVVRQAQDVVREAIANCHLPFPDIKAAIGENHDPSRNPIYQTRIALLRPATLEFLPKSCITGDAAWSGSFCGLSVRNLDLELPSARGEALDISLLATEIDGALWFSLEFNEFLFSQESAARLAAQFVTFVEGVASTPAASFGQIPLLARDARGDLIGRGEARRTHSITTNLADAIRARAEAHPDAIAVVAEGRETTYRELLERASRIANFLRLRGIGSEDRVALLLPRDESIVVATLGILLSGAAYVPIDLRYPEDRIRYILEDSRAKLLLAGSGLTPGEIETVTFEEALAAPVASIPSAASKAENLAYVIYTSGSSGRPKGALVTHENVLRLFESCREVFRFEPTDCWTLFHSHAFDFSVWEIFGPLLHGARVLVVPFEAVRSPSDFHDLVVRHRVTVLSQTPSAFREFVAEDVERGNTSSPLRYVIFGGEALEFQALRPWFERHPDNQPTLVNMYGITETTVHVTFRVVVSEDLALPGASIIGHPLDDLSAHVLDESLEPLPVGVAGELFVGGAGVCRGYLGKAALTAERFVPDPFSPVEGARLYRTGDLVRRLGSGELDYLGRIDFQVKLRGHRIELGEIDARLQEQSEVRATATIVRDDTPIGRALVAYVVPESESLKVESLRAALRDRLPDYMIPAFFVALDRLPLTDNGKLDRRALPPPVEVAAADEVPFEPPNGAVETAVAESFSEALGGKRIGRDSDFFGEGGHSLLALGALARVSERVGKKLSLRLLYLAPVVKDLARAIEELAEATLDSAGLVPADALSFAEERLFFLDRFESVGALYNVPFGIYLPSTIDHRRLERALTKLVARHESLRTRYTLADHGGPKRTVDEATAVELEVVKIEGGRPAAERELLADVDRPFDLAKGPLFRVRLLDLGEELALLFVHHHVMSDARSLHVLKRDLASLYDEEAKGNAVATLPKLSARYADFARNQRSETYDASELRRIVAELRSAPTGLPFGVPTPRPAALSYRGETATFQVLSAEELQALRSFARSESATVFSVLLAAFAAVLGRLARQYDVVVGSPVSLRTNSAWEDLVGYFLNTVPVRVDFRDRPTFRALAARCRASMAGFFAASTIPFERVVEALEVPRDQSTTPVFQVLYSLEEAFESTTTTRWESLAGGHQFAKFELVAMFRASDAGLSVVTEFMTDFHDRAAIEGVFGAVRALVVAGVRSPDTEVTLLPMMSEVVAERGLALHRPKKRLQRVRTFAELVLDAARANPQKIALVSGAARLSFEELVARARALASRFVESGVGVGSTVAICRERDEWIPIAIVASHLVGAAYCPLDPNQPPARRLAIASDAKARVVFADERRKAEFLGAGFAVVLPTEIEGAPTLTLPVVSSGVPAYVIYTSGTTGGPKGVVHSHETAARLFQGVVPVEFSSDDVWSSTHSFSFDVSMFEMFGALSRGSTLVVATSEEMRDPQLLAELVLREGVTVLSQTPTAFRGFTTEVLRRPAVARSITSILLAGEAVTASLLEPWYEAFGDGSPRFVNFYGPTETSYTTYEILERSSFDDASASPIGEPVTDLAAYVLDRELLPVKAGCLGELWMGGDGLALGYLGRPELTADRFLPDPWSPTGGRMYRTGDLVVRGDDERLRYFGRADKQVKIRGHRIELAEIEDRVRALDGVRDAAVIVRGDPTRGEDRLVGYVVAEAFDRARARTELGRDLPEYMIPSAFVEIAKIPSNANGKLDVLSLPAPEEDVAALVTGSGRGLFAGLVAAAWSEALRVPEPEADSDFFAQGGHSMLAMRMVSKLELVLSRRIPIRLLFLHSRFGDFLRALDAETDRAEALPPIVSVDRDRPLEPSVTQEGLWFLDQLTPGLSVYNMPVVLRLVGRLDEGALERALTLVSGRHESIRTSLVAVDGRPRLRIHPPAPWHLLVEQVDGPLEAEASATRFAVEPFDLSSDWMLKAKLVRVRGGGEALLVLVQHHVAADGWSSDILLRELSTAYAAFVAGQAPLLPALTVQFADYAAWQRAWLGGEARARRVDYFRKALEGAPDALSFPADRARPARATLAGAGVDVVLDTNLVSEIGRFAVRHSVTPFIVLFTAFAVALARWSRQKDVVIAVPVANRSRPDTENVIGYVMNPVPVRLRFDRESFADLVFTARDRILEAEANGELPFEAIVQELAPPRHLSRNPIHQVMFSPPVALRSGYDFGDGVRSEIVPPVHSTSRFDMMLALGEHDGTLRGSVEYSTELFDARTIEAFVASFRGLLSAAVRDPDVLASSLPLVAIENADQWHLAGLVTPLPAPAFIELFDAWVSKTPEAIAAEDAAESLSYAELARRAHRFARLLDEQALPPEALVALHGPRSVDYLAAILGCFWAGHPYLPLDPKYPIERLAEVVRESGAAVFVTDATRAAGMDVFRASGSSAAVLALPRGVAPVASAPKRAPSQGNRLAYVIYTSGSTGRPKGAMVEHSGMLNHLLAKVRDMGLVASDVVLQNASQSFDISVWQFLVALAVGARTVVASDDVALDSGALLRFCNERNVTVLESVPSLMQTAVEESEELPPKIRWVLATGEALPPELARRWLQRWPVAPIVNAYGPTECSDDVTHEFVRRPPAPTTEAMPIGGPLQNTFLYVLDDGLNPVPRGVIGELYVGGIGVGRGYLARPDLTAERFLPDPFAGDGARMYRTGDLVRITEERALVFLGRVDHQVKVRGFRIELDEIVSRLARRQGVGNAIVLVQDEGQPTARLVAYVQRAIGATDLDGGALRDGLRKELPDYMVPSQIAILDQFPLSPNGKVDRKALQGLRVFGSVTREAPKDRLEQIVLGAFEAVLGRNDVDLEQSFFDLGGHSLMAVRLVGDLRSELGIDLELRVLFEAPTIRGLAGRLRETHAGSRADLTVEQETFILE